MARLIAAVRAWTPDLRDAHVYGGAALVAVGLGAMFGVPAALVAFGSVLLVLGVIVR